MAPQPGSVEQQTSTKPAAPSSEAVTEGISAFLSRVFEQLSITSWLPAVFLVGNAAVLLALKGKKQLALTGAVQELVDLKWGALVVLFFAVIIVAMVVQAFEFENLRFWEGYLRSKLLRSWARRRIQTFRRRLDQLESHFGQLQLKAFDEARRRALDSGPTASEQAMWNAMEKVLHARKLDVGEDTIADRAAVQLNWPAKADPAQLHMWDMTRLALSEYPEPHRLLPTRLGNVMRAAEDVVVLAPGEDLEGFMIRHIDELPKTIVTEHAAYRRRLEMYCSLMFVLAWLSILSVFCFWGHTTDLAWRIVVPMLYLVGMWTSYKAAIASALGFGQAIKEATAWLQRQSPPSSVLSGQ